MSLYSQFFGLVTIVTKSIRIANPPLELRFSEVTRCR